MESCGKFADTGAGIADGDLLVVDRSEEAVHGKIVVAVAIRPW